MQTADFSSNRVDPAFSEEVKSTFKPIQERDIKRALEQK